MDGLCTVASSLPMGKRSHIAFILFLMATGIPFVSGAGTAVASEQFCRHGSQPGLHLSPLQGGASLLERLHSETPTFRLPSNGGCTVEPLGVALRDVENVTYQFGSVEPSLIVPSSDMPAGGFNLSFAANQSLQMQPGNIVLSAKEATTYVLQCQCLSGAPVLAAASRRDAEDTAASVALQGSVPIVANSLEAALAEAPLRLWGQSDVVNNSSASSASLVGRNDSVFPKTIAVVASHVISTPSSDTRISAQGGSDKRDLTRYQLIGNFQSDMKSSGSMFVPATAWPGNQSTKLASSNNTVAAVPLTSGVGWATTVIAHATMAFTHGVSLMVVLKVACMASNFVFQVSPLPQVQGWLQASSTGEVDAAPFVAIGVCGWQWCLYGLFAWRVTGREGFLILVHSNCVGAVLGIYYIASFWQNCKNVSAKGGCVKYLRGAVGVALVQAVAMLFLPIESSLKLSGWTASFCSLLSGLSTLLTVPAVFRTGSSASIPGAIVAAGLLTASLWFVCGIVLHDPCILVPNGVSIVVAAFCVGLKYWYPNKSKRSDLEDPAFDKSKPATALAGAEGKSFLVRRGGGGGADSAEAVTMDTPDCGSTCAGTGGSW